MSRVAAALFGAPGVLLVTVVGVYLASDSIRWMVAAGGSAVGMVLAIMHGRGASRLQRALTEALAGGVPQRLDERLGEAAAAWNCSIDAMEARIREIESATAAVVNAAERLSTSSRSVSRSADATIARVRAAMVSSSQIRGSFRSVAESTEQMRASIAEISRHAGDAARVANSAVGIADRAGEAVHALGASSVEISSVVKVITSIAEQTNLLALNATIEAAGAGDAGRGFAVVAGEVKELANGTARAIANISDRIEAIQADTQRAVAAIEEMGSVIHQISRYSSTIASAVEEQTESTCEIGNSVGLASSGTESIVDTIRNVDESVRSTGSELAAAQTVTDELEAAVKALQATLY